MNKIDQLISQYCPDGVERIKLGDCCNLKRGSTITAKDAIEGDIPVIAGGKTPAYYHNASNRTGETITIAGSGAYAGFVAYWNKPIFVSDAFTVAPKDNGLLVKYMYYFLINIQEQIFNTKRGSGVPHVQPSSIDGFFIPLPPLPVQEEIVRILDAMSDLVTNLDAEISARQKQYEHAREKLLTFGKEVERKTLGEVGEMIKGSGIMKSDFVDAGKPCIHYGQIHTYYKTSAFKTKSYISEALFAKSKYAVHGDLVIATTSEDVEACCKACAWLGDEPVAVSGDAHIFHHTQNAKYMSYLFQTEQFATQKRLAATGAKVVRVSGNSILQFEFPLPSLSVQQSIVERLDKMESLIQNLQAERALRQKQYEYYREKLLLFAK